MENSEDERISQRQAAILLGVHTRTIARMAERGELFKGEDGKFSKEEIVARQEAEEDANDESIEKVAISMLSAGYKQATEHAERMVRLLEGPIKSALETVTTVNTSVMAQNQAILVRVQEQESAHLEAMKVLGEILVQRDEREMMRREAEERQKTLHAAGRTAIDQIPKLVSQFAGKNKFTEFVAKLDNEEKTGIGQIYWAFEGEKREAFGALLKEFSLPIPPNPADEVVEESSNNV